MTFHKSSIISPNHTVSPRDASRRRRTNTRSGFVAAVTVCSVALGATTAASAVASAPAVSFAAPAQLAAGNALSVAAGDLHVSVWLGNGHGTLAGQTIKLVGHSPRSRVRVRLR